jgi:gamma-glutamylputrescine oxidase
MGGDAQLFNAGLNMGGSYYAATATPFGDRPHLVGDIDADLVVVGGGCTGLSAALHAVRQGLSVVVLEGGKIGWGASGRNGGQMIPGLRKGAAELVALFGRERAKALFDLSLEARTLVMDLIAEHQIACDLRATGHVLGAIKASDLRHLDEEIACLTDVMGYSDAVRLDADAVRGVVDAPYRGALVDRSGGHMHPLNYTLGLAKAAEGAGAVLHERSKAVALKRTAKGVRIATDLGAVRARHAVLAGDALLHGLSRRVNSRIMPVANYIAVTEPLDDAANLIPSDAAVSDTRFVVNYYRLTRDGRLLFGGGERYTPDPPADIATFVRPHMEAVFPQVRGRRIDYGWGGLVSVTTSRLPHIGREGAVLFAHGYSGMGAILSTLAGKLLAEEIAGTGRGRFDLFAGVEPRAFPGGVALRGPLYVLGMLWYAMRDRIG